jgi:leucyl aminopeptidase
MIDGKGMRPGDILVSASGKTVEVGNTDAEGRLTLCDALWYAQEKVGASKCVDIATLTGAQIVALGTHMGAVMSPHDDFAAAISASGCKTGGASPCLCTDSAFSTSEALSSDLFLG